MVPSFSLVMGHTLGASNPERVCGMTTPASFGQVAPPSGEETDSTLAEILGIDPELLERQLQTSFDRIRDSEREAEETSSTVRLY